MPPTQVATLGYTRNKQTGVETPIFPATQVTTPNRKFFAIHDAYFRKYQREACYNNDEMQELIETVDFDDEMTIEQLADCCVRA
jgi:hypothetical protein